MTQLITTESVGPDDTQWINLTTLPDEESIVVRQRWNKGIIALAKQSSDLAWQSGDAGVQNHTFISRQESAGQEEAAAAPAKPFWNSSRKKFVGISLPIQLLSIALVIYLAIKLLRIELSTVSIYNSQLMQSGVITISYLIFINLKDSALFFYQFIWGDNNGFDRALIMHALSLPLEIPALFGLCIWGSNCLFQPESYQCRLEKTCASFMATMQLIVLLGYVYVCICLFFKPIFICCYFKCF